ncbi:MAG: class I SAM-dependent methyltransferase [Spirosomataceae bacterium]
MKKNAEIYAKFTSHDIQMKAFFKRIVPSSLKPFFKNLYYQWVIRNSKTGLIPPSEFVFIGGGDFEKIGQEYMQYFKQLCDIQPNYKILDVGCGMGRMAVPLTTFLNSDGSYDGFDIVKLGIDWCQHKYTPYPNFHFQLADIYNKHYNPKGTYKADEYKFPYASNTFDFVFLTSVFTHMLPKDLENYLSEITRVMKDGGKCLITFFIVNEESTAGINAQKSIFSLKYDYGFYRVEVKEDPEAVIGYQEAFVRELYKKYGLTIQEPIRYGLWSGRSNYFTYQDIIIAQK